MFSPQRLRSSLLFIAILIMSFNSAQGKSVKGTLYVKTKDTYSKAYFKSALQELGIIERFRIKEIEAPFSGINKTLDHTFQLYFPDSIDLTIIIESLKNLSFIEYAEKVPLHKLSYTPDDLLVNQWNLEKINAAQAWDFSQGSIDITIAIIDNGVKITHKDLSPNIWVNLEEIPNNFIDDDLNGYIDDVNGYDVADLDNNPSPPPTTLNTSPFVHGTHVAGIASAATDNTFGIASLGFNTLIMSVKCTSDGSDGNNLDKAYDGIIYALRAGANVINMSFGTEDQSITGQNIINAAYDQGIVLVAAAGNEETDAITYPSGYEHVISVGATDQSDRKSTFSNFGSTIDVMAPGNSILSTLPESDLSFGLLSGTSMACPHVSALAALVLAINPDYIPVQVEQVIKDGCDNIDDLNQDYVGQIGKGRINALKTLSLVQESEVAEVEKDKLKVYPNPNAGIFKVAVGVDEKDGKFLRIVNVLGQTLINEPLNILKTKNIVRYDLTTLKKGIYFIQLYDSNKSYDTQKIAIQ